ncbi:MAG: hypothetical protein ACREMA_19795 [Longimicrobiales bacterium]
MPTFIHSYTDSTVNDGRITASIPSSLAEYDGTPSGRNATWGQRRFDSHDWTERTYRSSADEVRLTVIRSYDAKALYHHPELAVTDGPSFVRTEIRRFPQQPDIPVHVLYTNDPNGMLAMYALHHGTTFVQDPIRFQLRTAGELLFSGRKAMTLFFLTDEHVANAGKLPSLPMFFAAIEQFVATGGPAQ